MDSVNKTLYIPLYGKAYVSNRGLFLRDEKAEQIWGAEGFTLNGKSKSKWLAFYMGIRAAVFDDWVRCQLELAEDAVVIHLGCGLDSRVLRVGTHKCLWYDVDFGEVLQERQRYYSNSDHYRMLSGDARDCSWLGEIPKAKRGIVVMEGVSMYLTSLELQQLQGELCDHFEQLNVLLDCYSVKAAKLSKYKNPVNDVGVTRVYGLDEPKLLEQGSLVFVKEHSMTPQAYIDELKGAEKFIFSKLYAGGIAKKLYRLFEFRKS
jgi:O-methyltransferase involved in polyketide biosynthesis